MGSWSLDGSGCKGKFCLWPVEYQKFVNSDLKTVEKENPKFWSEKIINTKSWMLHYEAFIYHMKQISVSTNVFI